MLEACQTRPPRPRPDRRPRPARRLRARRRPAPIVPLAQLALADAVRDVEAHVAADGWDARPRVFALVRTADAIAANPELADQLPPEVVTAAAGSPTTSSRSSRRTWPTPRRSRSCSAGSPGRPPSTEPRSSPSA
ncbi:hypothetical protein NKG05_03705 [Oerskovia sp. M15]